ncbi:MAG TPA: 23S rRNA (adenine(2503)-C(2))-methyltransferase RlmN [Candidatus Limnocylindrales bacterium]|nr:23S rRNA (adenine(2503)-C(2))-methyltransferase RlmN [Candidatus Limnocylindrales bacterium]
MSPYWVGNVKADGKPNIKDLSSGELGEFLAAAKQPGYRAKQIWQWLFREHVTEFASMTNLPVPLREQLACSFTIGRLAIERRHDSRDGTVKFLFGLADGKSIESVVIPERQRLTICISTQVGCAYGCAFCATGLLGFKRNLTCGEIVEQILEANRALVEDRRITNVVLMGMGEPLANYEQTRRALEIMIDPAWGLAISPRKITLSSVGLVPQIQKLMEETNITLAISLHAATEELRGRLMPVNRKYSLEELIDCCRNLPLPRRKRITFEYVLLSGVNDSLADAKALCQVLRGVPSKVNVIPFNPHPGSEFQRPSDDAVQRFQQVLFDHKIQVNVRRPRGDDIAAACGQLQGQAQSESLDTDARVAAN